MFVDIYSVHYSNSKIFMNESIVYKIWRITTINPVDDSNSNYLKYCKHNFLFLNMCVYYSVSRCMIFSLIFQLMVPLTQRNMVLRLKTVSTTTKPSRWVWYWNRYANPYEMLSLYFYIPVIVISASIIALVNDYYQYPVFIFPRLILKNVSSLHA